MSLKKIKEGDIVLLNLDPTIGGEKGKQRPCVALLDEGHPWDIIIVLPITDAASEKSSRSNSFFIEIPLNEATGLSKLSTIDCYQIRCVSTKRISKIIGKVTQETMWSVRNLLARILGIGEEHFSR